jgi:hypothetical protein
MNFDKLLDFIYNKNINLTEMRGNINFCRETYDNWNEFPIQHEAEINKDFWELYLCTKTSLVCDSDNNPKWLLLQCSSDAEEAINLKQMDEILDVIAKKYPTTWGNVTLILSDIDVGNQIYSCISEEELMEAQIESLFEIPSASTVDEENNILYLEAST